MKERNARKTRCVSVMIDYLQTSISIDHLFKAAFYPEAVELLPKDGNRYNFNKSNLLPLMEEERGKSWGYSEKYRMYALRDGSVYGRRKHKLKCSTYYRDRIRYSLPTSSVPHIIVMLDAFGYNTPINMFDIDLTKPISLDEILKGHKGYPDDVYELGDDEFIPKRVISRTEVYDRVRYAYTGEVVENGLAVKPHMVGCIPYHKNIPVKVGVYSAFGKTEYNKYKHTIVVKDGDESNTSFKNLLLKERK